MVNNNLKFCIETVKNFRDLFVCVSIGKCGFSLVSFCFWIVGVSELIFLKERKLIIKVVSQRQQN